MKVWNTTIFRNILMAPVLAPSCFVLVWLGGISCGPSGNQPLPLELHSIIGENDLEPVASSDRAFAKAFGLVHSGCTAVHLGRGYILTAAHCIGGATRGVTYYESCPNDFEVTFGMVVDNRDGLTTAHCQSVVMRDFNQNVDYAVVKMDKDPGVRVTPNFQQPLSNGTDVSIFSYPLGRPLEWSGRCVLTQVNPKGHHLYHSCDTQMGSSGAPILNIDDEIVGIHTIGMDDHNGGIRIHNTALEELF